MKTLQQLCVPRPSVFDPQRRDTVLDLADLLDGRIDPTEFFETNYLTEGMKTLLEQSFRRLEGKSSQGIFKLKQAMGGGKTHNLLVLGLLARHPEYRQRIMGRFYTPDHDLGPVKVVGFSGRKSDAPLGVWGAIAGQLGKLDHFKECYSPLQAPGQKAWENLLSGETVLIFLDELPPYLENARAKAIGNSDLEQVTATALSNLLVALGKELVLLAWAIEDADPAPISTALTNWNGLVPEERWWLYTQTAAATGYGVSDRGRGWRRAVRYALTENPVLGRAADGAVVPEYFRRAAGTLFAGLGIAEGYEESAAAIET